LHDTGAENVLGGPVRGVKKMVLPGRIAEHMRRTIEQRALVQRLDKGEGKPVFGLPRQPDLDLVWIPDHCRSMDHLAAPRLRVLGAERSLGPERFDSTRFRLCVLVSGPQCGANLRGRRSSHRRRGQR
jgi:hypothetical protein